MTINVFDKFIGTNIWLLVFDKSTKYPISAEEQYYAHILGEDPYNNNYYKVEYISALIVECEYPEEDLYTEEFLTGYHGSLGQFDTMYINLDNIQLVTPTEMISTEDLMDILQQKFSDTVF